jgi:hypothetical protein
MAGLRKGAVGTDTGPLLQLLSRSQPEFAQSAANVKLHSVESEITTGGDRRIGQSVPDTF